MIRFTTPDPLRWTAPHDLDCDCPTCRARRHPRGGGPRTPEDGQTVTTPEQGQPIATRAITPRAITPRATPPKDHP